VTRRPHWLNFLGAAFVLGTPFRVAAALLALARGRR